MQTKGIRNILLPLLFFFSVGIEALTLEEAEEIGLKSNPQILAMEELAKASREEFHEIVSKWLPKVNADFEYIYSQEKLLLSSVLTPTSFTTIPQGQNNLWLGGVNFQQVLISKQLYHEIKAGRYDSERIRLELISLKNDILFEIRVAFWNFVLKREQLKVQEENIKNLTAAFEEELKRKASGKSSPFQVNQSKVAVFNAKTALYTYQKDFKVAKNRIIQLLGIDPQDECEAEICLEYRSFPIKQFPFFNEKLELLGLASDEKDGCPQRFYGGFFSQDEMNYWEDLAIGNSPDIEMRAKDIKIHNQRKKQYIGQYYPEVRAFASYRQVVPAPSFSQMRWTWLAGGIVNWDLFDGFGRESRINQEQHRENSSMWTYKRIRDNIVIAVQNSLTELEESFYSYFSSEQSRELSRLSSSQSFDKLKAGLITPLEYRDSLYNLAQAEYNSNQASFNLLKNYYDLIRLSGIEVERIKRCRK